MCEIENSKIQKYCSNCLKDQNADLDIYIVEAWEDCVEAELEMVCPECGWMLQTSRETIYVNRG